MLSAQDALDLIHSHMNKREWSPQTLEDIAAVLALAGYIIDPPE